ncbi:MAG: sigma 54-interacting transcriptional regulator [Candidatus Schekmanbacteria bacterium]|nr:sigma 54-interacting transcriptional regulator [Candidatus Schekmanbacteria bacterium]
MLTAVLRALVDLLRSSPVDRDEGLRYLLEAARHLLPGCASLVCLGAGDLDLPSLRAGESRLVRQAPHVLANLVSRVSTTADPFFLLSLEQPEPPPQLDPASDLRTLGLSSVALVPVRGRPTMLQPLAADSPRISVAALIAETPLNEPPLTERDLIDLCHLADIAGQILLLRKECSASVLQPGGRLTRSAFRSVVDELARLPRSGSRPCLLLVAIEGIEEVNQRYGFRQGDAALERATGTIIAALPPGSLAGDYGGVVTAVLMPDDCGQGPHGFVSQLVGVSSKDFREGEVELGLSIGLACAQALEQSGGEVSGLLDAAETALGESRSSGRPVVEWSPELPRKPSQRALSHLGPVGGASFRRILTIWRLFEALSRAGDLDELVLRTLESAIPLLRADRASFWGRDPQSGQWVEHVAIDRAGRRDPPPSEGALALVERASRREEPELHLAAGGPDALAVALTDATETFGVFHFHSEEGVLEAAGEQVAFLGDLSRLIGQALGQARTLERARRAQAERERRLREEARELRLLLHAQTGLIGEHPSMQALLERIRRVAPADAPVLIRGETGTGKEETARLIHRLSERSGLFVVVDCGAVPQALLESELFGHERGAFTGAESRRIGRFEQAQGGTIFLDEVGDLPRELQPKLLRVLQEAMLRRLGSSQDVSLDFRLIAATHRDLEALVVEDLFRQDLYYRLRVIELALPPLRERGDDVLLLATHFLRLYCSHLGREELVLSAGANALLSSHHWPGNVRELQNCLRRVAVMSRGPEVSAEDLHLAGGGPSRRSAEPRVSAAAKRQARGMSSALETSSTAPPPATGELRQALAEWFWDSWVAEGQTAPQDIVEAVLLRSALALGGGSMQSASRFLGMHADTFSEHLSRLGHPGLSRSLWHHRAGRAIEAELAVRADPASLRDELLAVILRELLVLCRGNKSEMSRRLGWTPKTLHRHLQRLGIGRF